MTNLIKIHNATTNEVIEKEASKIELENIKSIQENHVSSIKEAEERKKALNDKLSAFNISIEDLRFLLS